MAMSEIDPRQLEIVTQYVSFIDFFSRPEKVKGFLESLEKNLAEYKEKLGLIQTKAQADLYLKQAEELLAEANKHLSKEKAEQDATFNESMESLGKKNEEATRYADALRKRLEATENNFRASEEALASAKAKQAEADRNSKVVIAKQEELKALEAELTAKKEKLDKLIGDYLGDVR